MSMMVNPYRFGSGPAGDPYWSNVALLSGFEGSNGSTTLADESSHAHSMTAAGNAQISTAQKKFGASSLLLDGNNDYATIPDSSAFTIGSNDFTIEMFVRFADGGAITAGFAGHRTTAGNAQSAWMYYIQSGTLNFRYFSSSSLNDSSVSWSPSANTWYHICVERASDAIRHYIDGARVLKDTFGYNFAINDSAVNLVVGTSDIQTSFDMNGYIDEFRFTNGVARYASDSGFVVPTAAYPRS